MELYFLRHAPAVPRGAPGYQDDSGRPLTPEGVRKMERVARGIQALDLEFSMVLSSPYIRARQTAEIAARALALSRSLKFSPNLAPPASPEKLIQEILGESPCPRSVLLVGHEPFLSDLICLLIGASGRGSIRLKKAGLAKIAAEQLRFGPCGVIHWLLTPKQLLLLARSD